MRLLCFARRRPSPPSGQCSVTQLYFFPYVANTSCLGQVVDYRSDRLCFSDFRSSPRRIALLDESQLTELRVFSSRYHVKDRLPNRTAASGGVTESRAIRSKEAADCTLDDVPPTHITAPCDLAFGSTVKGFLHYCLNTL